jgi:hypothetical protein
MECHRQILGDAKCLSDAFSEVGGKTGVLVANDFLGESEPLEHVF